MVYSKQNGAFELESAAFDGGRFFATSSGVETRYYIADHLGSVRVIVDDNGEVIERNDFYPFGLRWNNDAAPIADNRYRYNAKEEQAFLALPYIDYGARMYDPKYNIRWNSVDPLAEKFLYLSPFAFCAGNPIKFMDPNGRKIVDAQGNLLYHDGKWTDAAKGTAAMVIGNAIMRTNMGRILWNRLSDAEYNITFELHPGKGKIKKELGVTITNRINDERISAAIHIYKGSIAEQSKPQYTGERAQRLRSLSEEDRIGMIGVHEATHAVYDTPDSSTSEREARAEASEIRHVWELDLKKSIIPEDRNLFDPTIKFKSL